jgi:hypothetical protein
MCAPLSNGSRHTHAQYALVNAPGIPNPAQRRPSLHDSPSLELAGLRFRVPVARRTSAKTCDANCTDSVESSSMRLRNHASAPTAGIATANPCRVVTRA